MRNVRFIGLDVHAETIAVAVTEPDGEVRSVGVIPNRSESIRKLVKKLGERANGPCHRQCHKRVGTRRSGTRRINNLQRSNGRSVIGLDSKMGLCARILARS